MPFLKEDLVSAAYTWNEPIVFAGSPSRRTFNRHNGDQMLFLINSYGALSERFTITEGQKVEALIMDTLPLEIKSELSVFHWLKGIL